MGIDTRRLRTVAGATLAIISATYLVGSLVAAIDVIPGNLEVLRDAERYWDHGDARRGIALSVLTVSFSLTMTMLGIAVTRGSSLAAVTVFPLLVLLIAFSSAIRKVEIGTAVTLTALIYSLALLCLSWWIDWRRWRLQAGR